MIEDIKNGIREKDFIKKYSVCRKTYFNYKKIIYDELGKSTKRVYKRKVDLEEFEKYRLSHTIKQCISHFDIAERLAYKYDKLLRDGVLEKQIQEEEDVRQHTPDVQKHILQTEV